MTNPRTPPEIRKQIEDLALQTYFRSTTSQYLATDLGRFLLGQHVWERYEQARYNLAPWVDRAAGLAGRRLVEIGCGTGSSTAGFASLAARVDGYEISQVSVAMAQGRLQVLGIGNAAVHQIDAESLMRAACERHRGAVDGFLLFAVLEHMTIPERILALRMAWAELPPGGLLIVIETPNRLTYTDLHTAQMPFFHMLPLELAVQYYQHSKRPDFTASLDAVPAASRELALARWGNGVSFHEFDVALGAGVDGCIVADGFEPEVKWLQPPRLDDELLLRYFEAHPVGRHRAFTRNHLNFVLRKP
ncbi:MAG: methyltransferase domain-containing protein [Planctomycetota bacterium]